MKKQLKIISEATAQIKDGPGRKKRYLKVNRDVEGAGNIHNRVRETIENDKEAKKKVKVEKTIKLKKTNRSLKEESNVHPSLKDTNEHIGKVRKYMNIFEEDIKNRKDIHDKSKLEEPELSIFDEYGINLSKLEYGSKEYKEQLKRMKPALDHHYANNRHHPEYHPNGIKDMNLVDIIEMVCDWKASSERYANGDFIKSIDINKERFGYSDELQQLIKNTIKDYLK